MADRAGLPSPSYSDLTAAYKHHTRRTRRSEQQDAGRQRRTGNRIFRTGTAGRIGTVVIGIRIDHRINGQRRFADFMGLGLEIGRDAEPGFADALRPYEARVWLRWEDSR